MSLLCGMRSSEREISTSSVNDFNFPRELDRGLYWNEDVV